VCRKPSHHLAELSQQIGMFIIFFPKIQQLTDPAASTKRQVFTLNA
jgi:hypothetical protein